MYEGYPGQIDFGSSLCEVRVSKVQVIGNQSLTSAKTSLIFGYSMNYSTGGLQTLHPPQGTRIHFFHCNPQIR